MNQAGLRARMLAEPAVDLESLFEVSPRFLEMLPIAIAICDAEARVIAFNGRAADLWGHAPRIGEPLAMDAVPGVSNGRGSGESLVAEALRTGRKPDDAEGLINRADGSSVWVMAHVEPVRGDGDRVVGAIACFHDIGERKRAEDRLRRHEAELAALLEALPAAIYTTDAEGHITFYNAAAAELWGRHPPPGTVWCGSWRLERPDGTLLDHAECPMAVALREDRPVRDAEAVAARPDGTRVPFTPYPTPLHDSAGRLVGGVNMLIDLRQSKSNEARMNLLAAEVDHRANNLLAVLQAAVRLSDGETPGALKRAIEGRVRALGHAHALLARSHWRGADLADLVAEELGPLGGPEERVTIAGPSLILPAAAAQAMGMALHELAANAARHGALSVPSGGVTVEWGIEAGQFGLRWTETGGPAVEPPARRGFGTHVLERVVRHQLEGGVTLDWKATGLVCTVTAPATRFGPPTSH